MKNCISLFLSVIAGLTPCLAADLSSAKQNSITALPQNYMQFKEKLHTQYGLDYRARVGLLWQHAAPGGGHTAFRDKYEVEANWEMFQSSRWGSGSVQLLYENMDYPHQTAALVGQQAGIVEPINDDAFERRFLKRLTYTHHFAGKLEPFSVSIGQFLIGYFGKTSYKSLPFSYFNNFALAKNVTKGYPTGGVGTYLTYQPSKSLTFITGLQDTTNYFPKGVSLNHIQDDRWTSFFYASKTWHLMPQGKTVLTGWVYHSPSIKKYAGQLNKAYPTASDGFLINLRQDLNDWTFFAKANASSGNRMAVKQSYALDIIYHNPLKRNPLDQIGFGLASNKVSQLNKKAVRSWEHVAEIYWAWGLSHFFTITPSFQIYLDPALTTRRRTVTVSSIECKIFL